MQNEVQFNFEKAPSSIFGYVFRPIALVYFYAKKTDVWIPVWGIVDSGADYTLLPKGYAEKLGIDLTKDCEEHETFGIGGEEKSKIYREGRLRIGDWKRIAPIGFLGTNDIPPLFGRQGFLETFEVVFDNHKTIFRLNKDG